MRASIVIATLTALAAAPVTLGQAGQPDSGQMQLDALIAEHKASELSYPEAYQAFKPRFEQFAKQHRGTEAEVGADLWLIQNTWWLRDDGKMESTSEPLAQDLISRHPDSPQLGMLVEYRYVFDKQQQITLYNKLLEISPHREVKAAAEFGLAQTQPPRDADGKPNPHYAALLKDYADVRWRASTYGAIADARLNPLKPEDLAVGKTAPEIEGIDQNGKPMKLSDFRGKVVLLDFWGDW